MQNQENNLLQFAHHAALICGTSIVLAVSKYKFQHMSNDFKAFFNAVFGLLMSLASLTVSYEMGLIQSIALPLAFYVLFLSISIGARGWMHIVSFSFWRFMLQPFLIKLGFNQEKVVDAMEDPLFKDTVLNDTPWKIKDKLQ